MKVKKSISFDGGWTDGRVDGWTGGWMDGWTNELTDRQLDLPS